MPPIVTNGRALPGTSANFSNNVIEIGMGNKLLVDIGIVNTIVMGGWNRLLACTSTVIQIGTKIDVTLANSVSVFEGDSWMYSGSNNTTYDIASRWGVWINLFAGGTSYAERQSRWSEEKQSRIIRFAAITGFLATIAVSLVGIQYPPFKMTVKPAEDPDNITGTNPETGEIYYGDEELTSVELNPGGIPVILFESLFILALFVGQWILAKKMADNLKDFNSTSNLSLAANGLTSAVFSDPDRQPVLRPATPEANYPRDEYVWLKENSVSPRSQYRARQAGGISAPLKTGSSPAAIFNMLPGMPVDGAIAKADIDPTLKNWRNIKKGLYPEHDDRPVITLSSQLEPHKKTSTALDMTPESILITAQQGLKSIHDKSEEASTDKYCFHSASIKLSVEPIINGQSQSQNELASQVLIESTNKACQGGIMLMNDEMTAIYRHGQSIELSVMGNGTTPQVPPSPPSLLPPTSSSSDDNSITDSQGSQDEEQPVTGAETGAKSSRNSLLYMDDNRAALSTDDGDNGIFISAKGVKIRSKGQDVALFTPSGIDSFATSLTSKGVDVSGVFVVKQPKAAKATSTLKGRNVKMAGALNIKVTEIKNRIRLMEAHQANTGGFSGTLADDAKKQLPWYSPGLYQQGNAGTKFGTFKPGIKGILDAVIGTVWPWW